jgi:hypothetical protein
MWRGSVVDLNAANVTKMDEATKVGANDAHHFFSRGTSSPYGL